MQRAMAAEAESAREAKAKVLSTVSRFFSNYIQPADRPRFYNGPGSKKRIRNLPKRAPSQLGVGTEVPPTVGGVAQWLWTSAFGWRTHPDLCPIYG